MHPKAMLIRKKGLVNHVGIDMGNGIVFHNNLKKVSISALFPNMLMAKMLSAYPFLILFVFMCLKILSVYYIPRNRTVR